MSDSGFEWLDDAEKFARLRLPMPGSLRHVNLYALWDRDGWLLVDSGVQKPEHQELIQGYFKTYLLPKGALKRLVITHYHPDHIGNIGWVLGQFGGDLLISAGEMTMAKRMIAPPTDKTMAFVRHFYQKDVQVPDHILEMIEQGYANFRRSISALPDNTTIHTISDGDRLDINGTTWHVSTHSGHSPEQVMLRRDDNDIAIVADVLLSRITPNISLWPFEDQDIYPLQAHFEAMQKLVTDLPPQTMLYPGHGSPFDNGPQRAQEIIDHHHERLDLIKKLRQDTPEMTPFEMLMPVFNRELRPASMIFAIGEIMAHLQYLDTYVSP